MKFRFTMQAVLDHRDHLQHEAEMALAKEVQAMARLERVLQETKDEYFRLTGNRGGVEVSQGERLMDYVWYSQQLKVRIARQKQEIEEQGARVRKARADLVLRTQDKKAIEVVRDNQLSAFKLAEKRKMEKLTDESGQNRFVRADKEVQ